MATMDDTAQARIRWFHLTPGGLRDRIAGGREVLLCPNVTTGFIPVVR